MPELASFKINSALAETGDWVDDPLIGGIRIKTRGLGSWAYRNRLGRIRAAMPPARHGVPEHEDRAQAEAIATAALLDWAGLEENGELIPFSSDRALELLLDPDFSILLSACLVAATAVDARAAGAGGQEAA